MMSSQCVEDDVQKNGVALDGREGAEPLSGRDEAVESGVGPADRGGGLEV